MDKEEGNTFEVGWAKVKAKRIKYQKPSTAALERMTRCLAMEVNRVRSPPISAGCVRESARSIALSLHSYPE